MHVHMTIFWTIVLGIIGSIIGGAVTHMFSPPTGRFHPAGIIFSTLGAILLLFIALSCISVSPAFSKRREEKLRPWSLAAASRSRGGRSAARPSTPTPINSLFPLLLSSPPSTSRFPIYSFHPRGSIPLPSHLHSYPIRSNINVFPSLGRAHRGGDAFPFRRQAGKIMGQSGEIAIDCNGAAARLVSRRIFQRRG